MLCFLYVCPQEERNARLHLVMIAELIEKMVVEVL